MLILGISKVSRMERLIEYFTLILLVLVSFICHPSYCNLIDSLSTNQSVKDGETVISSDGSFELGFFSPGFSTNRYVGIWYKKTIYPKTVVWVANRENPVVDELGVLKVIIPGIIVILNHTGHIVWSTNTSRTVQNPVARLLDSGNLVVKDVGDDNQGSFLWQSFDYPTDTLLPSMKLGRNFLTGLEVYLSAWRSGEDPAPGEFTFHCDPSGFPQNTINRGPKKIRRSFEGLLQPMKEPPFATKGMVINKEEVYYTYISYNSSFISRLILSNNGVIQRWNWDNQTQVWVIYRTGPADYCDTYRLCGAYGSCSVGKSPACSCLDKFVPKNEEAWALADWSSGCERSKSLNCLKGDIFLKYSGINFPDTEYSWFNRSMTLEDCKAMCLKNCSCMAYANLEITSNGRSGCLLWYGDLVDIREIPNGKEIYIRISSSELASGDKQDGKKRKVRILSISAVTVFLGVSLTIIWTWRKIFRKLQLGKLVHGCMKNGNYESHDEELELPVFEFSTLMKATNNFAITNKLGEGGFGIVYKGMLEKGEEIAVKRLSRTSMQGLDELKNEIHCIAKLQHRNLVKILGFCIQEDERMLIYEYMANKSLDLFIFDDTQRESLDWPMHFHIINGISRGLMYLHQDSCLRVIHRDLKASNILLDTSMNPKISDFGLAKIFAGNETGANTNRVVGTYGYMSPEYAVHGLFSVKSDVFSFGVIVLEIISGKSNRGFSHEEHHHNLLGHAWMLYREGRSKEVVDPNLVNSCYLPEMLRCIHVALLCVQQRPEDRPNMSTVLLMLGNEGLLPPAKQPGFFTETALPVKDHIYASNSKNVISISLVQPR
ncbi:hypothetical protein ACH5RR_037988 [Cinchona calisaya]|uniref:Receptor-like serine/threonine-protein kinase n=1 Tax=Cinchona calisaya TaxID=153742 RepID=A0ABD2YBR8_9GENT